MATAALLACVLQRKRGIFRTGNMVLIILAFNLTIFGNFLARGIVVTSVRDFGLSDLNKEATWQR